LVFSVENLADLAEKDASFAETALAAAPGAVERHHGLCLAMLPC
jgi:hypothetical protein